MTQLDSEKATPSFKEKIFHGKEVVITGGSSGIGQAIAEQFSKSGSHVTVIDISQPTHEDDNMLFVEASVGDAEALSHQRLGKIDLLIIAAGVTSETNEPTDEEKDLMNSVNVDGVKNTLEVYTPLLASNAVVVYIGSDDPPKNYYAETKRKGARFVKQFSEEHRDTKTLITYLGPVRTLLFEKGKPQEVIQRIEDKVGLYEPDEFAEELIDQIVALSQDTDNFREKVMYKGRNQR